MRRLLNSIKEPIHFIGIGGIGMSALAECAARDGIKVQGSDPSGNSNCLRLQELGVRVYGQHDAKNLDGCGTVVYSSAIKKENPEYLQAQSLEIPLLHRSDVLAQLIDQHQSIAVTGTHGKTTTSALLAHVLQQLELDPSFVGGGIVCDWKSNARLGQSSILVAECDESDGTLESYRPSMAIITNLDDDHLDFYTSIDHQKSVFQKFCNQIKKDGCLALCWDNAHLRQLQIPDGIQRIAYGFRLGADIRAFNLRYDSGRMYFDCMVERQALKVDSPLVGEHQAQNIMACLAIAKHMGLNLDKTAAAISCFGGVERRMQILYNARQKIILDDYAHNPGKIQSCLQALAQMWPQVPALVIFQPHRFSRLQHDFHGFLKALDLSPELMLLPVYSAGEDDDPSLALNHLQSRFAAHRGRPILAAVSLEQAIERATEWIKNHPRAVVLSLGAGDVYKVAEALALSIGRST